jgi:hypothetical protein
VNASRQAAGRSATARPRRSGRGFTSGHDNDCNRWTRSRWHGFDTFTGRRPRIADLFASPDGLGVSLDPIFHCGSRRHGYDHEIAREPVRWRKRPANIEITDVVLGHRHDQRLCSSASVALNVLSGVLASDARPLALLPPTRQGSGFNEARARRPGKGPIWRARPAATMAGFNEARARRPGNGWHVQPRASQPGRDVASMRPGRDGPGTVANAQMANAANQLLQ